MEVDENGKEKPKVTKFVHMNVVEKDKTQWMEDLSDQPAPPPSSGFAARFDLNGRLLPFNADVPVNEGLHHHGEEPERAGYTVNELLILARSTYDQQKILSLEVLAKLLDNTKKGLFDKALEQNLTETLLDSGLVFLLRVLMDDPTERIILKATACLHRLIANEIDELCLDYTFSWHMGHIQPSLPSAITKPGTDRNEYLEEKDELKDDEVLKLDVITGLLRMDILDRIHYILSTLRPSATTVTELLKILIRIGRHSLESANAVVGHGPLMSTIVASFLPTSFSVYEEQGGQNAYGTPVNAALKLLRVLSSWTRSMALKILAASPALPSTLLCYLSFDPSEARSLPTFEGLRLVLEAFRTWTVFLAYNLMFEQFVEFYPLLMRQLMFYCAQVDMKDTEPKDKYNHDHGSALLCVLRGAAGCMPTAHLPSAEASLNWEQVSSFLPPVETCLKKWSSQLSSSSAPPSDSALNLFASCLSTTAVLLNRLKQQKEFNPLTAQERTKEVTEKLGLFLNSGVFRSLLGSCCSSSGFLSHEKSGHVRDPPNLPSLSSVGFDAVIVPCIADRSPFNVLTSTCFLVNECLKTGAMLPMLGNVLQEASLVKYLESLNADRRQFASNWFSRIETHFVDQLVRVNHRVNAWPKVFGHKCALFVMSVLHTGDELLAKDLMQTVIFNPDYFDQEVLITNSLGHLGLVDRPPSTSLALAIIPHLKNIFMLYRPYVIASEKRLRASESTFGRISFATDTLTERNNGETLLPTDWEYLPLLVLYDRNNADKSATDVSSDMDLCAVRQCLQWILLSRSQNQSRPSAQSLAVQFSRLSIVFLAAADLFLEREIRSLIEACLHQILSHGVQDGVQDGVHLNLDQPIPGIDSYFDLYASLIDQFNAVSYGDSLFAVFLVLPLAVRHSKKLRQHFWSSECLRMIALKTEEVPLRLGEFIEEPDPEMARSLFKALISEAVVEKRNPFLFELATSQLGRFMDNPENAKVKDEMVKIVEKKDKLCAVKPFVKFMKE